MNGSNNSENRWERQQNPPFLVKKGAAFLVVPCHGANSSVGWNYQLHGTEKAVCRHLSSCNRLASCVFSAHIPKKLFCHSFLLTLLTLYLHSVTF